MAVVPGYQITKTLVNSKRSCVLRAIRESDGCPVIIKQLNATPEPGQLSRFAFSYDIVCQLSHANIVKSLEWLDTVGRPTMIMEDIGGVESLAFLNSFPRQQFPLPLFLKLAIEAVDALVAIHRQHIIHKDLHPGNIVVNPQTHRLQIIDFGLATLLSREQPLLEPVDRLEGAIPYIAPEQTGRMNRALDYRADFYTLGATFYHWLVGQPPFGLEAPHNLAQLVHAHVAKIPEPLDSFRHDLPQVLISIIEKLLQKTAEARYQSAIGLLKDLQRCQRALSQNIETPEFPLGMDDVSDRLQIPQKLYGRQPEVDLLMAEFFCASKGQARVVAVGGYSGVGKSALVHEIHKPIAAVNGIFVSGKFDQFQTNTPYAALKVAMGGWLKYALTMDDVAFNNLKHELLTALGSSAGVLIDFMSEFSLLLGDLPAVPKLGSDETKTRLHLVMQTFFKEATRHRPLVVFIDDLQWADRGTLDLLPHLLAEQDCRLLVIVAYRDNEVDESHPAMMAISHMEKSPVNVGALQHIHLKPLQVENLMEMLQETLLRTSQDVQSLAELVRDKTAGNPFFIGEFLKELYVAQLLEFDHRLYYWQWDYDAISRQDITDNVLDLMLHKMQRLPQDTQELIQLGSCIGGQFDLEMLALVSGQSLTKVTQRIWPALKQGVLLQDGGDWLLGTQHHQVRAMVYYSPEESLQSQSSPIAPKCRFLHDRMLQAAYQSMSLLVRQQTHLHIAKALLRNENIDQLSTDQLFSIVDHLNIASPLIEERAERTQLATLNYRAAAMAKAASVWSAAASYCRSGVVLLQEDGWRTDYQLIRDLYIIKAECEYLSGQQAQAENDYRLLLQYLPDDLLKADILSVRLTQAIGRGEWLSGLNYGKQALIILGYPLPSNEKLESLYSIELSKLSKFGGCDQILSKITELSPLKSPALRLVLQINANLNICAYLLNQQALREYLSVSSMNLILKNGNSDITAISLSLFSLYLRWQRQYRDAFLAAKLCRKLIDSQSSWGASSCCSTIGLASWYLHAPMKDALEVHEQGFLIGLENGELARAAINRSNTAFLQLSSGMNLNKVVRRTQATMRYLDKVGVYQTAARIVNSAANAMVQASPEGYQDLNNSNYPDIEKFKDTAHYMVLLSTRTLLCFWFDNITEAMRNASELLSHGDSTQSAGSLAFDCALVVSLLAWRNPALIDPNTQHAANQYEQQLKQVAELYPANFSHKYSLLQAEKERRLGGPMREIVKHYQAAIDSALANGFIQYVALANEYFAEYWIESGFQQAAVPYLNEAIYHYHRWGCKIKVRSLRAAYADWNAEDRASLFSGVTSSESVPTGTDIRSTLDMASVMKAAQAISKELDLKKVAENILHVIEECAGATATAFIDANQAEPLIIGYSQAATGVVIPSEDMPVPGSGVVPVNVVSYVLRTRTRVNFGDAFGEKAFVDDPYMIAHQPRSLLCIPVFLGNDQMNILYLENTLTLDAFTEERLDAINLLLSQAVISLSNARLYSEMNQLNVGLEQKVEARSNELAKTLKKLELANEDLNSFSYSVSHDLRSPLRSLKGFGKMLIDEYNQEFDEQGVNLLERIVTNCNKMTGLIDGLLELSRIQRRELTVVDVDLSTMVVELFAEMKERYPHQKVAVSYQEGCLVRADERMLHAVMENLLQNAWKYSRNKDVAKIEFGAIDISQRESLLDMSLLPLGVSEETTIYFIADNGAGFNLKKANKLFTAFHRMHTEKQFEGTGIGLSTVYRIIEKHGGHIWAQAEVDQGATFYFTIPSAIPCPVGSDHR